MASPLKLGSRVVGVGRPFLISLPLLQLAERTRQYHNLPIGSLLAQRGAVNVGCFPDFLPVDPKICMNQNVPERRRSMEVQIVTPHRRVVRLSTHDRMRGFSALFDTRSTFLPRSRARSSINPACSTKPTFAAGRNSTSRSMSLSGRISPRAADPNSESSRTSYRLRRIS